MVRCSDAPEFGKYSDTGTKNSLEAQHAGRILKSVMSAVPTASNNWRHKTASIVQTGNTEEHRFKSIFS